MVPPPAPNLHEGESSVPILLALAVPAVPAHPTAEGSAATWTWQAVAPRTMRAVLLCVVLLWGKDRWRCRRCCCCWAFMLPSPVASVRNDNGRPRSFSSFGNSRRGSIGVGRGGNSSNGLVPRDIPSLVRCDVPLSPPLLLVLFLVRWMS